MSEAVSKSEADIQQELLDKVLFIRDLNEVHLLIDFVSGRSEKRLEDLRVPDAAEPHQFMPPFKVVEGVALIKYPPSPNGGQRAKDAAFLLAAKDGLSALASPARGMTIAYTSMFTGVAYSGRNGAGSDVNKLALARAAYPNLADHAMWFRWVRRALTAFTFIWLVLTALTYWDVSYGRDLMQRAGQIDKDRADLIKRAPDIVLQSYCAQAENSAPHAANCQEAQRLEGAEATLARDLDSFRNCTAGTCLRWMHALHWGFVICGVPEETTEATARSINSIINVFTTYVLPLMFGVLGTLIGSMRAIQAKVRESVLSPRDLLLTLFGLPIGAVAGVAVGLYFSPSEAMATLGTGGGNLSLSASALGFLAGYGSDSFFKLLDGVLERVFSLKPLVAPGPPASSLRAPPANPPPNPGQ